MSAGVKEAFLREIGKKEPDINLAYAALLIAEYLTGPLEIPHYLALLDQLADDAPPLTIENAPSLETLTTYNHYMFAGQKFSGNEANYYHPDNSFLNKVLELRTGIPISLSVVYIEVGRRLGLPLWGIGMPGHFIVGYGPPGQPIYVDVFNQGKILSEDDCLTLCQIPDSSRWSFKSQYLKPASRRAILYRMLLNLKQIYIGWEDWQSAYRTVDLMLRLQPQEITEIRDRGLLAYRLDRLQEAIFDVKRYLFLAPKSIDASWLEKRVEAMEEKLLRLN